MSHQLFNLSQLTEEQYTAIQQLHQECSRFEQINIKINWDMIKRRSGVDTNDFLCYVDKKLVGYLALYVFNSSEAEVSAIVHPDYRRQGILKKLLTRAGLELRKRGIPQFLFIVDHQSHSGQQVAKCMKTEFAHAEFQMKMSANHWKLPNMKQIQLEEACLRDTAELAQLDAKCFHMDLARCMEMVKGDFTKPNRVHLVLKRDGKIISKINIRLSQQNGYIYGFCVDPEFQGQGLGTAILSAALQRFQDQVETFSLEVVAENRHALRLYERCGFRFLSQDDYFALPVS
ncbi:GNAT family N-acetyltransferase [Desmospora activa]|uniref:Ribosomal protein S18 acetylase RimI-like enzyme n=1 Tax=Desmospora activa DSM 45169 TaxID=1121389 RepID=A0A2T4Z7J6_9BACL|nr:GNAT family N-acetyltransferase [Desmospora activa]PTM57860.1 ribosomal protein S18 acetylase RimI-like enzyme [Desmospora activa DSM 45169]